MDKKFLAGSVIGAVLVTAGGAIAGFNLINKEPSYAEVLSVNEVKETVQVPREVCRDVTVNRQQPVQDQHKILGTVTGAVIGGLLGSQIGSGSGKKIATVAGAAAGGYGGNKVQGNMQNNSTYATTERRCNTVSEAQEKLLGYDVRYLLGKEEGSVRMDHRPGARIPVRDGQLLLSDVPPANTQ